ncbi:FAD-linked oxidase [Janibacter sp. Soil728]|uniref:FAD-binding oxidoreductase n=1 Tax=Janibacter sp. Soil728 TaxID=1736393 RepID=UPI0006F6F754|nr:FAD-linked oxidase C-terminal domain-containing protein [Janibacter sp. Soil728]KRE35966.1 FAD-linked oxidase [Janibacter sp. Soil728]
MSTAVLSDLVDELPEGVVVIDADVVEAYRADMASLVEPGRPLAVVRPTSTTEVSRCLAWAQRTGTPVVPRGAGTGLSGGAAARDGSIVLSLERMDRIREIDHGNHLVVVEAGVVNADVSRAVAQHGLFYAPDPGSFEVSTIGGNLATNAGGMRCVKYGVTRQSVLGLEVVLADGRVLTTGGRTVKDVAGLDLTQLMIGSEGTLGVITAATLRVRPAPAKTATFIASFGTLDQGSRALAAIFASGITPSVLEMLDRHTVNAVEDHQRMDLNRDAALLLIGQTDGGASVADADALVELCLEAGADMALATSDPEEGHLFMHARRLAGWVVMEQGPTVIEDVAVPRTRIGEMLTRVEGISRAVGLPIATVGHAGDGNLHPMLRLPDQSEHSRRMGLEAADRICAAAIALDGTITGEHGVGELKREHLHQHLDATSIDVQVAIKRALDPGGILNPGRGF